MSNTADDENRYGDYAGGIRVERVLAHLSSIPDPYERIHECAEASEQARSIQSKIAAIRRQAIYEATLEPGASGDSVAATLGVSPKAVSSAISDYRKEDLALFREVLAVYLNGVPTEQPSTILKAASGTRDVLFAAKTVLDTNSSRTIKDETEEQFELLERGADRARVLARTGRVELKSGGWDRSLLFQATPDESHLSASQKFLSRVLNSLPQIFVSVWEDESDWYISTHVRAAEPYSSVFDAGPHRDGWASAEWLVWFFRDWARSGYSVEQYPTSPPPFLNEPGESMALVARFDSDPNLKSVGPLELAESVIKVWDQTGYSEVDWPSRDD